MKTAYKHATYLLSLGFCLDVENLRENFEILDITSIVVYSSCCLL